MPNQLELIQEAYKRGILPESKKPLYEEAVRRGIIKGVEASPPAGVPTPPPSFVPPNIAAKVQNSPDAASLIATGVTPGNYEQFAEAHYQDNVAKGGATDAASRTALYAAYREMAGEAAKRETNYADVARQQQVQQQESVGGRFLNAGQAALGNFGKVGTDLIGVVAPETANNLEQEYSTVLNADGESRSGQAGNIAAEIAKLVAIRKMGGGPKALAGFYGLQGFGGSRVDAAQRRENGQDVSLGTELGTAAGVGGVEALSGYVSGKVFDAIGPTLKGAIGKVPMKDLVRQAVTLLGGALAEGTEEGITQAVENKIRQMGQAPEVALSEGVAQAFISGAILSPFGEAFGKHGESKLSPTDAKSKAQQVASADVGGTTSVEVDGQKAVSHPIEFKSAEEVGKWAAQHDPDVKENPSYANDTATFFSENLKKYGDGTFKLTDVPLDKIDQQQSNYQPEKVAEYAKQSGETQPPVVLGSKDGKYEPVDGNTRIRAARERGETTIKAYVRDSEGASDALRVGGQSSPTVEASGDGVRGAVNGDAGQAGRSSRVPQDVLAGPKAGLIKWAEEQGIPLRATGSKVRILKDIETYNAKYEAASSKADRAQLPPDAKSWDAGKLRDFARENGYKLNESMITGEMEQTPGLKPREAVRRHIEAQYFRPVGEGPVGKLPAKKPLPSKAAGPELPGHEGFLADPNAKAPAPSPAPAPAANPIPKIPNKTASVEAIRQFATEQGIKLPKNGSREVLRKIIKRNVDDKLTSLPRMPKTSRQMSFKQLSYWAKQNGYQVDGIVGRGKLVTEIRDQRKSDLKSIREAGKTKAPEQQGRKPWPSPVQKSEDGDIFKNGRFISPEEAGAKLPPEAYTGELRRKADTMPDYVSPEFDSNGNIVPRRRKTDTKPEAFPLKEGEYTFQTPEEAIAEGELAMKSISKATPPGGTAKKLAAVAKTFDSIITPLASRVRDLSPAVYDRLMRMEFTTGVTRENEKKLLVPVMERMTEKLGGPKSAEYKTFKQHVINGDFAAAKKMVDADDFQHVQDMLDRLHVAQKSAGIKVGFLENYWPRHISDYKDFDALYGDDKGRFEDAWDLAARATARGTLTNEEKVEVANSVLAGYGPRKPGSYGPVHARTRSIEKVSTEQAEHYGDPFASLMKYVDSSTYAAERARFLGRNHDVSQLGETVGEIVKGEVEKGSLKKDDQQELASLLHTRFLADMLTPGSAVRALKQSTYMLTLGQFRNAINQATDLAVTAASHGVGNALKGTADAIHLTSAEGRRMMEDVGLHEYGEEFKDSSKIGQLTSKVLARTGFQRLDRIGKEARVNAARRRFKEAALSRGEDFKAIEREYRPILGNKFDQTMRDAAEGNATEDVRYMEFLDLTKVQPVTLSQMPEQYLKMKNGRILYALKTFTIQQIDWLRRDVVRKLATPGQRREGISTAASLIVLATLLGVSKEFLTDLIRGKTPSADAVPDKAVDTVLGLVGLNKFVLEQASESPVKATINFLSPPMGWIDAIYSDVTGQSTKGFKSLKYVPFIGDLLYTRFGAGAAKNEADQIAKYKEQLKDIRREAYDAHTAGDNARARELLTVYNGMRKDGPGDGRNQPLSFADLRFLPPGSEELKDKKATKQEIIAAMKSGNQNKARELLKSYNAGRANPTTASDLRKSVEVSKKTDTMLGR